LAIFIIPNAQSCGLVEFRLLLAWLGWLGLACLGRWALCVLSGSGVRKAHQFPMRRLVVFFDCHITTLVAFYGISGRRRGADGAGAGAGVLLDLDSRCRWALCVPSGTLWRLGCRCCWYTPVFCILPRALLRLHDRNSHSVRQFEFWLRGYTFSRRCRRRRAVPRGTFGAEASGVLIGLWAVWWFSMTTINWTFSLQ
jgi:hypothetical protein